MVAFSQKRTTIKVNNFYQIKSISVIISQDYYVYNVYTDDRSSTVRPFIIIIIIIFIHFSMLWLLFFFISYQFLGIF